MKNEKHVIFSDKNSVKVECLWGKALDANCVSIKAIPNDEKEIQDPIISID